MMGEEQAGDAVAVPEQGAIEKKVRQDIDRLGSLDTGVRGSLAEVALRLARTLDAQDADTPATTTARLAQELRTTLMALMGVNVNDTSEIDRLFSLMRSPLRDAEDIRTDDAR